MTVTLLRAKLHRIRVTEACRDYVGSLTVDVDLMEAAGLFANEKILCADVENGNRFETYVIPGPRGSGVCCLNGAAAYMGKVGAYLVSTARDQLHLQHAPVSPAAYDAVLCHHVPAALNRPVVYPHV